MVESVLQTHRIVAMPAARPRMHVTPTDHSFRLLAELSKLTGKAPATIVRELLEEAAPALEMTINAYRDIQKRPEEARAAVLRMAAEAQGMVNQALLDLDIDKKPGRKPGGAGAAKPR